MKKYLEEHKDLAMILGVLIALAIIGSAIVAYEYGIAIGLEALAVYIVIYSALFALSVLPLSNVLARIAYFSPWKIFIVGLAVLFDAALFVVAVTYVRVQIFAQTYALGPRASDPGFWFLNIVGAIVIMTAAVWAINLADEKIFERIAKKN